MKNLTKREQFLIYVLIFLVVGSAFAFLIFLPSLNTLKASQASLADLQVQHQEMDQRLQLYGTLDDDVADARAKAEEKLAYILPTKDNEEISNDIVNLAKSSSLNLISVSVNDPSISAVDPLKPEQTTATSDEPTTYPLKEYLYQIFGTSETLNSDPSFDEILLNRNQVTLVFTSSQVDYLAFLDRIRDQYTSMRVVSSAAQVQTTTTQYAPATTTYYYNEDGTMTEVQNDAKTYDTKSTVYTVVVDIYSTEGKN